MEGVAGTRRRVADVLAFGLALYALYWVIGIVDPQIYRVSFLLIALVLTFLLYPAGPPSAEPALQETLSPAGPTLQETLSPAEPALQETLSPAEPALQETLSPAEPALQETLSPAEPALQETLSPAEPAPHESLLRRAIDGVLIALSIVALTWPIVDFDEFVLRAATPEPLDIALGVITVLIVLEATRRTTGWILPVTAGLFLAYAYVGPQLDRVGLSLIAHRGYAVDRLVGTLYMTLEGIFGVPLDVAATYIVLFTIYGAVLEHSGAAHFFVSWASAAVGGTGGGSGAGRTVTIAGYLLGSVSGSGVANTVMLGSVTWPMMRKAGYPPDVGGAVLAAAGIGAIMAPPTMGAAAFLIAEYLQISYLQVIAMAVVPAILYYLSVFLMVEADSRRLALRPVDLRLPTLWTITRGGWQHFVSLLSILVLLLQGLTAFRAVFWATLIAFGLSFLNRETALWPRRLATALTAGGRAVLPIAATTACAGVIVGVVTLTGLGLKVAGMIVTLAGSSVPLTAIYSAGAVWLLGLAVPVTASYIIAAVMIVPALTAVGVAAVAAHMFVFYYAVLSEVSPPTALSPFAAAAVTGGNPFRTTMLSWKYTAPAFVVPFVFTVDPRGLAVLMQAPVVDVLWTSLAAALGVAAVAAGAGGWIRGAASLPERVTSIVAGVLLLLPRPASVVTGAALFGAVLAVHWYRTDKRSGIQAASGGPSRRRSP